MSEHINWQTPSKRSQEYVQTISKELNERAQVDMHIDSIKRLPNKKGIMEIHVTARQGNSDPRSYMFDEVIFACHPDQALSLLGGDATEDEKKSLSAFRYADNDTYVHCDENLMPRSKAAWTSWNYMSNTDGSIDHKPVYVTYWLNKLQSISHNKPIFVSLNPSSPPDLTKTFSRIQYAHPQFSLHAVAAQRDVASIQGANNTYFCGAWMGFGFHEDGFRSGLEVAMVISKTPVPWMYKVFEHYNVNFDNKKNDVKGSSSLLNSLVLKPAGLMLERMCQQQVIAFLRQGFVKGNLTIILPNNEKVEMSGHLPGHQACVKVNRYMFFVRVALEADIGMARSFIAGDWEVVEHLQLPGGSTASSTATRPCIVSNRYDNLTALLSLLVDNMPHGTASSEGGWDAKKLLAAYIGSTINKLYYNIAMGNSIANSQSNIHAVRCSVFNC
ncbi:hypothetical protein EON65_08375 [archaeon]|nr:MAG: hypothetical protein EON65_08375 [archaeon]